LSTYNYFYFLTTPNNKLHSLIETIYHNTNDKFIILVKNNEQMIQIQSFLKTKSMHAIALETAPDEQTPLFADTHICIIPETAIKKLAKVTESATLISLYGSITKEQVEEKYNLVKNNQDSKLIELISKNDFDFIQVFYKDVDFNVKRYAIKDIAKNDSLKIHMNHFVKKCINDKTNLKNESLQADCESIFNETFATFSEDEKNTFLKDFFLWSTMHAAVPTLNVTDSNKKYKKVYIHIHHGLLDQITKKQLTGYFQQCPDLESLDIKKLDQSKTIICAKGYNLKVNSVTQFIDSHQYEGQELGYTVVNEEFVNQECAREREGDAQSAPRKKFFDRDNRESSHKPFYGNRGGRESGGYQGNNGFSRPRFDRDRNDRGERSERGDRGDRGPRKFNNHDRERSENNRNGSEYDNSNRYQSRQSGYQQRNHKPFYNKQQWRDNDNNKYSYGKDRSYDEESTFRKKNIENGESER
jgi:hypothetical protein